MSYQDYLTSLSRTPVTLVIITLDCCGRTFGAPPCLAGGSPCYNTYSTCKYTSAYLRQNKDYKFTSASAPLPFGQHERPYLKAVKYLPCDIKDNLTINARVNAEFYDEPDTDVGIDPYVSQRSSVQGTFWQKLLARNPNYKGRQVKIYEGFIGIPEAEFQQKWIGVIENITLGKASVKIEVVDLLKSLSGKEIPPKLDIKLVSDIAAAATEITLTTVTGLDSPSGYVRLGDEIIYYTAVNTSTNQITGCTRGFFSTVAGAHRANAKVQRTRYYAPANPFDILMEMLLTDAEIDASYVDTTAFNYWRDWPGGEVNFSAIISEPTKLDKLYFEIADLIDCNSWIAEDLKITIRRNIPNEPGRSYFVITDDANIIHSSSSVDLHEKSRLTRILIYWDKTTLGKTDEVKEYSRLDIAVDADAEGANEYGDTIEKKYFCRWLRAGYMQEGPLQTFIKNTLTRQLFRQRNAQPIVTHDVELKDSGIKTGSYCRVSTDDLLNRDGTALSNEIFKVVKRDFKGHKINLKLLRLPSAKWGFIAPDNIPDYDSASDAQKEYCFISDSSGLLDDRPGYYIW